MTLIAPGLSWGSRRKCRQHKEGNNPSCFLEEAARVDVSLPLEFQTWLTILCRCLVLWASYSPPEGLQVASSKGGYSTDLPGSLER